MLQTSHTCVSQFAHNIFIIFFDSLKIGGSSKTITDLDIAKRKAHHEVVNILEMWGKDAEDPSHAKFKAWLDSIKCGKFFQPFIDAGYDLDIINDQGLSEEDLDCVGVSRENELGFRKKLMSKWKIEDYVDGGGEDDDYDDDDDDSDEEDSDEESGSGSDDDSGSESDNDESGSGSDDDERGSEEEESDEE